METMAVFHVGTLSYELIDRIQNFPIALRGHECEDEVPPNGPNTRLGHDVPDFLSSAGGGPGVRDRAGPQDPGTGAGQAPGRPERATECDWVGEGAHDAIRSEGSKGQYGFPGGAVDRINLF